jgi:hypothetical protein
MSQRPYDDRRALEVRRARDLIAAARAERAAMSIAAPERDFYLGVEAAAAVVLRPEAAARDDQWLARESPGFRDGYLKTQHLLTLATGEPAATSLSLPEPG